MTPERWQQIDNLLQAVIERPLEEREALLTEACSEDESLRRAVESLLTFEEEAEGFLERSALEDTVELYGNSRPELMAGEFVGSYRIESQIDFGGMGEVYLAEDTRLHRNVAIKFLPAYLEDDELARKRLIREAQAVAKLDHPNICAVYEVEEEANRSYIVMQYVSGGTLAARIKGQPLRVIEALNVCVKIVEALAEAHSREIIHRDIKPGNVMIDERGQIKVLDFGLAKLIGSAQAEQGNRRPESMLSRAGARAGTPPYMSPEQARGDPVDVRSDLFAVGVVLYECLTGVRPFSGNTENEILSQVNYLNPPRPSKLNRNVRPQLDNVVMKALQKERDARYQSAADLLEDLRAVLQAENRTLVERVLFRLTSSKAASFVWATGATLCLAVLAYFIIKTILPISPYRPSAEAVNQYNNGVVSLHDGSYYEATKKLRQAIGVDNNFALAHARLAEAFNELDYSDQAKDEVIQAESLARQLPLPQRDALYLNALTKTVLRDFPHAIESYQQIAGQVSDQEKVNVYMDLGKAYENNDELENARKIYQQVTNLAPQWPTAFLRLGVVCGKLQDFKSASDVFVKAETFYQALNNQEGVAEVFYQRGFFSIDEGDVAKAESELDHAIQMATSSGNKYQLVRAMQALSSVLALEGKLTQAEQQASEAIQLALNNGIENQAVSGSIRLGDVLLMRGDFAEAETHYQEALRLAQSFRMRVNEAWARRQLGSLRSQQHKADEALSYLQPAADFFQQQGYRKWSSQTLTLLARAYRDKGDYAAALIAFGELEQLGEQLRDPSQVALAKIGIGSVLANEEQYSEALRYFDESYRIFNSPKSQIYLGYAAKSRASVLWQLGRSDEARAALTEATSIAEGVEGRYEPLLVDIYLVHALLELSEGHFRECESWSRQVLELANTKYPDVAVVAKQTLGLSRIRSGASHVGARLCDEALELAKSIGDPQLISGALLASAEASLASGQASHALETALGAEESFARFGKADSEWRGWLIAAEASRRLHDDTAAREYASRALSRVSDIERAEAYDHYLQRFDIAAFRKQLDQLLKR